MVFDSQAAIGAGQGVYMSAAATLFEKEGEIARGIEAFSSRSVAHGSLGWASQDVRPGVGLCLYRATADSHWILAKDGRPDHRIPVPLTLWTATGSSRSTALTCAWTLLARLHVCETAAAAASRARGGSAVNSWEYWHADRPNGLRQLAALRDLPGQAAGRSVIESGNDMRAAVLRQAIGTNVGVSEPCDVSAVIRPRPFGCCWPV